jgi:hypothetical protein
VVQAVRQPESEPVMLVTGDSDFGRDGRLHPELLADLQDAGVDGARVQLCTSVTDVLDRLADKAQEPEDLDQVLNGEQAAHAVNAALQQGAAPVQLLRPFRDQFRGPESMEMRITAAEDLVPGAGGRTVAYRIGTQTWVSAERRWSGVYWVSLDRADARYHQPPFDVPFEVDVTVLVAPERSGAEGIQVIDCGMLRLRGDWIVPSAYRRP